MLLGVWVLVLPFLGFPGGWLKTMSIITGLVVIAVAYRMKPANLPIKAASDKPYVEHKAEQKAAEPAAPPVADKDPGVHNSLANPDISGSI